MNQNTIAIIIILSFFAGIIAAKTAYTTKSFVNGLTVFVSIFGIAYAAYLQIA